MRAPWLRSRWFICLSSHYHAHFKLSCPVDGVPISLRAETNPSTRFCDQKGRFAQVLRRKVEAANLEFESSLSAVDCFDELLYCLYHTLEHLFSARIANLRCTSSQCLDSFCCSSGRIEASCITATEAVVQRMLSLLLDFDFHFNVFCWALKRKVSLFKYPMMEIVPCPIVRRLNIS